MTAHRLPVLVVPALLVAACGDAPSPAAPADTGSAVDAAPTDAAPDAPPPPLVAPVRSESGRLRTADGREVLLRGLNVRAEGIFDVTFDDGRLPLMPIPALTATDCAFMADELGMNLIRLPINWSAVEPVRGTYDAAYLDRVAQTVAACAAAGVYTLVDLHQDAYSKEIGQDGAPLWAIVPPPTTLLGGPLTDLGDRRLSAQVLAAFNSLYANTDGLIDAYAAMAAHVAASIADLPGVVGLELQNEPVAFREAPLAAFHEQIATAVRAAAPDLPIHFEPDGTRNLRDFFTIHIAFPFDNAVYAPHIYTGVFSGARDNWSSGDVSVLRASMLAARAEADAHHAALLVGEYGIDPGAPNGLRWVETELGLQDETLASSAFWVYEEHSEGNWGLFDTDGPADAPTRGALRSALADTLAHPFPQAIDGHIVSTAWDAAARTLTVTLDHAGNGEHWLSAPRRVYPNGVIATCDGAAVASPIDHGHASVTCTGRVLTLAPPE